MKNTALLFIAPFLFNTALLMTMDNNSPKLGRLRPEERRPWYAPETERLTPEARKKIIQEQNRRSPSPLPSRCKKILTKQKRNYSKLSDGEK
ncbi:MAG TPA: hypothetical protein VJJ26_00035 [Candidatus Babeliales bacterium]|nr:hypothetical protein [Candidatus Babeliales bacterium]